MALPKPQLNGDVLAYDERQTDEVNANAQRVADGFGRKGALPAGNAGSSSYWTALTSGIYQTIGGAGITGLPGAYGVAVVYNSGSYISVTFTSSTNTGTGFGAWIFSGSWLKIT